jgi:2-polyprenyl-3-methyl-5-hydroxy-6-metoxy-1,4-benzoquinol methylase
MINRILETYKTCSYDFRIHAYSQDPLAHLFEEWVDYYRLKWAISKVLQPASILEIGVRYGYGARAFLDASSKSQYVGLDADLPNFGGHVGAIDWAKKSLKHYDVQLIRGNSQSLKKLPGDQYDLIHVDGQQDGDGTFHDLNLALNQGQFILIDGYFWTRENFLSANEWLWLNKAAIEWFIVIPGYAGEMLIKTNLKPNITAQDSSANSLSLVSSYTSDYYLSDCGGYKQWRINKGKDLEDMRLHTVAAVASAIASPKKVMDLGAGRGELTFHFAKKGAAVTAVDYSPDAIKLIEQTFEAEPKARNRVQLICGSVTDASVYDGNYDVVMATDIIEHLAPDELEILYSLVSQSLNPDTGVLVVHTAPNLWLYRYEHPRQQLAAKQIGFWLPKQRRSFYERLMHINEQSPVVLKKQLERHFPHVLLWFATEGDMMGSLHRRFTIANMRQATSLFAVASHQPINLNAIKSSLCMEPLHESEVEKITLRCTETIGQMVIGERYHIKVILYNGSHQLLSSYNPYPLHLSYHWEDNTNGLSVIYDGLRTRLTPICKPHEEQSYDVLVKAPEIAGSYILKIVAVQEGIRWHKSTDQTTQLVEVKLNIN